MCVNTRNCAASRLPPTPYDATDRVHDSREKSKGGENFVFRPIRDSAIYSTNDKDQLYTYGGLID